MSSISTNPNPNPHSPTINQPSALNPSIESSKSNRKKKKRSKRRNSKKKNKNPNWLELPEDAWFSILSKLNTFDIIVNVQKVCMLFRKICKQPSMFKSIDMFLPQINSMVFRDSLNSMIRYAVDRSAGGLLDIYVDSVDLATLMYIVHRSSNLKHLRLGRDIGISDERLIEAIEKLPTLEEVQLMFTHSSKTVEAIGNSCSSLKSFSLVKTDSGKRYPIGNEDALAIAKSMPHLRHLQLIGNVMSNEGLKAILDGCPLLESLDLHACSYIDLSGDLGKRCEKLKPLRCPNDFYKDYGRLAYEEEMANISMFEDYSDYEYGSDDSYLYDYYPDFDDYGDSEYDNEYESLYYYFGGCALSD